MLLAGCGSGAKAVATHTPLLPTLSGDILTASAETQTAISLTPAHTFTPVSATTQIHLSETPTSALASSSTGKSTEEPSAAAIETPTLRTPTATPTATPTVTPVNTLTAAEIAYINITPTPGVSLYQTCMLDAECTPPPAPPIERLQHTENILFLGTDLREGWDSWRTDTIMLLVIDHETDQMAVISFPRDLYVYDPKIGKRKINVLDNLGEKYGYNEGAFKVIKDVFEYNFGIPIDHVVRAHRGAFVEFVDAIGGIDVTLDCDLWEISPKDDGGYYVLYLPAGVHHLDGETALQFATYRYRTSDWGRARRQQAVLAAMKNQALQLGLLTKAPELWNIVKRNVSSDIGFLDMVRYAQYAVNLDMGNIHSHVFSNRELTYTNLPENGAYVLFPKEEHSFSDVLENIFAYVPISVQGTHQKGCPPTPDWADDYLASLTPTPSP